MARLFRWLHARWCARLRAIDLLTLWPAFLDTADDLELARKMFRLHTRLDPVWQVLPEHEVDRIVAGLR
jgi:hypothetical protein